MSGPAGADAAWEAARHAPRDGAPVLSVDGMDAPLDWLLEMARAKKLDLRAISIVTLVESFAAAFEAGLAQRKEDLGRWGDWLVMAATLALLRSRLMLPAGAPEARAAQAEAEALRKTLVARAEMRAAADWLAAREQHTFGPGRVAVPRAGRTHDLGDFLRATLDMLHRELRELPTPSVRPPPAWRMGDAIVHLRRHLPGLAADAPRPLWSLLPPLAPSLEEAARERRLRETGSALFAASLELARAGELGLEQDQPLGSVLVLPRAG